MVRMQCWLKSFKLACWATVRGEGAVVSKEVCQFGSGLCVVEIGTQYGLAGQLI